MKANLFIPILIVNLINVVFFKDFTWAQAPFADQAKWGGAVQGVQMSVSLTNHVLAVGSKAALLAEIKNSSTNVVTVFVSDPIVNNFTVSLTNSEKTYIIAEPSGAISAIFPPINIPSGETRNWEVTLTIGKDVQPGDYTLKATRSFKTQGTDFQLVSNFLKVRVR